MDEFNFEDVRIAAPCKSSWAKMKGDDRVRFCSQCELNVYNVMDMTQEEAVNLISETEGRLCIRLWRRRDGTIITKDCPMSFKKLRYGYAVLSTLIGGAVLSTMHFFGMISSQELELAEKKKDLEAGHCARGRVVVAVKNMTRGSRIFQSDLVEREVDYQRIPNNAIGSKNVIDGMRLANDVEEGTIFSWRDILPQEGALVKPDPEAFEMNLTQSELKVVDEIARKKRSSVSQIMNRWIHERIQKEN